METYLSHRTRRTRRRINGLQLPLNYQQVIGWIVLIITTLINFFILIEIQFKELKTISIILYVILYICHVVSHGAALLTDPGERELRKLKVFNVPEFDRSIHAHVIENGRCHLCNIYTSSRSTKHCSICNKCVGHFDHHCKWLNNCVGDRNYASFIACVISALLISILTSVLCLTDIVLFLVKPHHLSLKAQSFFNCSSVDVEVYEYNRYCPNSIAFITFLTVFCVTTIAIACALLHLYCFHVYIAFLGISTYEYIIKSISSSSQSRCDCSCCLKNFSRQLYRVSKHKEMHNKKDHIESVEKKVSNLNMKVTQISNSQNNRASMISILIANELDKAKKVFVNKNKIHPGSRNVKVDS